MIGTRLVYAQQDLSNKTNDLLVYNDQADYSDAGLSIGPGGALTNLRMSYNSLQATAHITTDTLSIDAEQVKLPNIQQSSLTQKPYTYVVMDNLGNLKQGYSHYAGDINVAISSINTNITNAEATIQSLTNQIAALGSSGSSTHNQDLTLIYILGGFVFLFLIFLVVQIVLNIKKSNEIDQLRTQIKQLQVNGVPSGMPASGLIGLPTISESVIENPSDILGFTSEAPSPTTTPTPSTGPESVLSGPTPTTPEPDATADLLNTISSLGKKRLLNYISNQL